MAEQQNIPTFKLVLVGDGGTGKVSLLWSVSLTIRPPLSRDILRANSRRNTLLPLALKVSPRSVHRGQRLIRQYIRSRFIPTLDKSALTRGTQPDRRSSAGCETGIISKVVPRAAIDLTVPGQCGIIMFDVTSRITYKNVPNWHRTSLSPPIQSPRPRANTSNMPR
jgi:GTP-binding nuclear protein Ran